LPVGVLLRLPPGEGDFPGKRLLLSLDVRRLPWLLGLEVAAAAARMIPVPVGGKGKTEHLGLIEIAQTAIKEWTRFKKTTQPPSAPQAVEDSHSNEHTRMNQSKKKSASCRDRHHKP